MLVPDHFKKLNKSLQNFILKEEGRRKKEEGRGEREEGRGKREEGGRKREEGRGKRVGLTYGGPETGFFRESVGQNEVFS